MTNASLSLTIAAAETNALYAGKCDASYICLPGSTTKTPNDGVQGYLCPKGHFCQSGYVVERKCLPGTYNDMTG